MYAIVDIAGQQFKVEKDQKIFVHRLEGEEGTNVTLDKVLLVDNDGDVKVGMPSVAGVTINAKILSHMKGDKVLVFKKKRRKSYQKLNGHRQFLTQIQIENIVTGGSPKAKRASKKATAEAEKTEPAQE
jgi:large subunit ribosomal protein L21